MFSSEASPPRWDILLDSKETEGGGLEGWVCVRPRRTSAVSRSLSCSDFCGLTGWQVQPERGSCPHSTQMVAQARPEQIL